MFTPSTLTVSGAVLEIADCAGASGDVEQQARAGRALNNAIKYLNSRQNWAWLYTEASPISVIGAFNIALTAGATGVASASAVAGHGVLTGDIIVGRGFSLGTRVSATAASALGFNTTFTGTTGSFTVTGGRDFYDLPSDWKMPYSVRLLNSRTPLGYTQRRAYDRGIGDEFIFSQPQGYDLFSVYQKGKIRLLPVPAQSDVLQLRYYRRMTVPTATGDTSVLDIPQDYDYHLIAWAKWHYLIDKSDGRGDQAATWLSLAKEGLATMLSDQTRIPDETLGFMSQHQPSFLDFNPNSTRNISWTYAG